MVQDDSQLVTRVLAGEKTAFGLLIDRYCPAAIKLARRVLGDTLEAEDVAQEALLQAFLGLASLRNPDLDRGCWESSLTCRKCGFAPGVIGIRQRNGTAGE